MALILARSPFFVNNEGFDENASLTVEINRIIDDIPTTEVIDTYVLNFRKQTDIDISNLVAPYTKQYLDGVRVKTVVSGAISGVAQSDVISYYPATNGYAYHEEGYNYNYGTISAENCYYAGSNDCIYALDDESINIPFVYTETSDSEISEATIRLNFMLKGEVVYTTQLAVGDEQAQYNRTASYFNNLGFYESFKERVEYDGGTLEDSSCLDKFFKTYSINEVDEVILSCDGYVKKLKVVSISECKYEPYRVKFMNKLGAEEDIWFFKRSDKSLNVSRESYMKNTFDDYKAGDVSNHIFPNYNVNGKETISLNSGWIPESFYENLKQLMLSEDVWIKYKGKKLPINIKSTELQEKLHRNDKLINYTIEAEFSYNVISSVF